jgi:hypothetical protein
MSKARILAAEDQRYFRDLLEGLREERGIAEFGRAVPAPQETPCHAVFHEAQCWRLRSFAQHGRARESSPANCKRLIVGANEEVTTQFAGLPSSVPGTELSPGFERGSGESTPLGSMGRIDVDGEFGMDLVHMPTGERFAPVWPFAGHGALGTIFLLGSKVGASAAGLAQVSASLAARPFHVVMLGEGGRLSPDDLRKNLSLMDDASPFLLPIEPEKDLSSVIRSLFARIVQ